MLHGKKSEIKYTYGMISILLFNTNTWLPGDFTHIHTHTHEEKRLEGDNQMFTVLILCSVHGDIMETTLPFLYFSNLQQANTSTII